MFTWKINKWTSDLLISADIELTDEFKEKVIVILDYIESVYRKKDEGRVPFDKQLIISTDLYKYAYPDKTGDYTCMLKGAAIDEIKSLLNKLNSNSYVISFGGDIFCKNSKLKVKIDNSNFYLIVDGTYSIFTSGNTEKRGHHIIGNDYIYQATVVVKWTKDVGINNTIVDVLATKLVANEILNIEELEDHIESSNGIVKEFYVNSDGKLENKTYIASPFFNSEQIEIRDKMASKFIAPFRPDLTRSSKRYELNPTGDGYVEAVVEDNISGIKNSEYLVYPMRTTDLGTLFEVGIALGSDKTIVRYNEELDEYYILSNLNGIVTFDETKKLLFDCSNKIDAILMGFMSSKCPDKPLYYQLNGCKDNIMLSVKYHHVELEGDKYIEYERDKSEKDQ